MSKIIIGIHGMGNKPDIKQLQFWWQCAIREGLEGKGRFYFLKFRLVYWASILNDFPLTIIKEPYMRAENKNIPHQNSEMRKRIRDQINEQLDKIFLEKDGSLNFNRITDFIIHHFLKDLDAYYADLPDEKDRIKRDMICQELALTLHKNRRKKILLVAHSMGSIIAWDVLTSYVPHVKIHTLVTIGSPLGIPVVKSRIISELKKSFPDYSVPVTPENIQHNWFNLADFKDRVAFNYDLKDEFLPNKKQVSPKDILVHNNYEYENNENHHKSYGYLRCPEMANIITEFYSSRNRKC